MRSLALASALLAMAMASGGCAVIGAKAPDPDRPRDQPPMCNDGKGGVVVDGLMTTTLGIITLALASEGEGEAAAITGLGALAYGISAGAGSSSANKCRAAMDEYVAMQKQQDAEAAFVRASGAPGGGGDRAPGGGVTMVGGIPVVDEEEDRPGAVTPPLQPRPQPQPQPQPQPEPEPVAKSVPAPRPTPARTSDDDEGDWSEFWKEVP